MPHLMSRVAGEYVCCMEVCICTALVTPRRILCTCVFAECAQRLQGTLAANGSPNKPAAGAERSADGALGLNWAQSTTICHTGVSCYVFLAAE